MCVGGGVGRKGAIFHLTAHDPIIVIAFKYCTSHNHVIDILDSQVAQMADSDFPRLIISEDCSRCTIIIDGFTRSASGVWIGGKEIPIRELRLVDQLFAFGPPVDTLLMELAQESNCGTSLFARFKIQTRIVQKKKIEFFLKKKHFRLKI